MSPKLDSTVVTCGWPASMPSGYQPGAVPAQLVPLETAESVPVLDAWEDRDRLRMRVAARSAASGAASRGRQDGLVAEAAVHLIVDRLGWSRATDSEVADRLVGAVESLHGLQVARSSAVEGLYSVPGRDRLVYVEVSGAFAAVRVPGLERSDTAHKLHSRVRLMLDAADRTRLPRPVPVVFTSDLPRPGTEAGGVVLALATLGAAVVQFDEDGRILGCFSSDRLRAQLTRSDGQIPSGRRSSTNRGSAA